MRIQELRLKDWRVIRQADFLDLSDFVIIAGPNGVGKTHIKEAIVHIFQKGSNPPANSKVVLQATNDEERAKPNIMIFIWSMRYQHTRKKSTA